MSGFITLSAIATKPHLFNFQNIGKTKGFTSFFSKTYLVYNTGRCEWGIQSLNILERIIRYVFPFFYQQTHKNTVKNHFKAYILAIPNEMRINPSFITRINEIWPDTFLPIASGGKVSPLILPDSVLDSAAKKTIAPVMAQRDAYTLRNFDLDSPVQTPPSPAASENDSNERVQTNQSQIPNIFPAVPQLTTLPEKNTTEQPPSITRRMEAADSTPKVSPNIPPHPPQFSACILPHPPHSTPSRETTPRTVGGGASQEIKIPKTRGSPSHKKTNSNS